MKKNISRIGPSVHFTPKTVAEYLAAVPKESRTALNKLRKVIKSVVPRADEVLWYRMPAFKLDKMLVSYAAFSHHCSLFPLSAAVLAAHKNDLKGYETSKGTIRFSPDKPLPVSLVKKIVKARIIENEQRRTRMVKNPGRTK